MGQNTQRLAREHIDRVLLLGLGVQKEGLQVCDASDIPLTGDVTVLSDSSHLRFGSVDPELHRKSKFGAQSLTFVLCGPYPDTQSQAEPLWSVNSQGRAIVPSWLSEMA